MTPSVRFWHKYYDQCFSNSSCAECKYQLKKTISNILLITTRTTNNTICFFSKIKTVSDHSCFIETHTIIETIQGSHITNLNLEQQFIVRATFSSFFVRATSESSSFDYYVFKSFQFSKIKLFLKNLANLGHKILIN